MIFQDASLLLALYTESQWKAENLFRVSLGKQAARATGGRAGLRRIAMCTWRVVGPGC